MIQSRGVSVVRVESDMSRLCERTRSTLMVSSFSPARREKDGGSEYGGDGGRGEIGLWKEWNESVLEEILGDSFSLFCGMGMLDVEFEGGVVLNVN